MAGRLWRALRFVAVVGYAHARELEIPPSGAAGTRGAGDGDCGRTGTRGGERAEARGGQPRAVGGHGREGPASAEADGGTCQARSRARLDHLGRTRRFY
ncbi:MAG: hypothetical protein EBS05_20605 [Proteobacteria bacterium]|nr:hypothetical protein [Pseudomonadota bacterium]